MDALLERFDILYKNPADKKQGFMLAKDSRGTKLWARTDERGLPDSYAPGDIGYANLSPDIQKVLAQIYLHGGLGALASETEEDSAYTRLRYLRAENIDCRCKGKAYPGPKVVALTNPTTPTASITNPGFEDEGTWVPPDGDSGRSDASPRTGSWHWRAASGGISRSYQDMERNRWAGGMQYTFTCYSKRNYGTGFGQSRIGIDDGINETLSDYTESLTYVPLSITKTLNTAATRLRLVLYSDSTGVTSSGDFDDCAISQSGSLTMGVSSCSADFNNKNYRSFGQVLAKLKADGTGFDYVAWMPYTITHLVAFPHQLVNELYIALGASNKYYYMDADEVFTKSILDDGEADKFRKVGTNFYQLKLPNKVRKATGGNPANDGGWDGQILVGESSYNVNDLQEHDGFLYCMKQDGPYYVDASGNVHQPFPELASIAHADAGKNSVVAFHSLYFRMGNIQEREVSGGIIEEITPSMFAPGVAEYVYPIVARAQDDDWVYALMYRANNNIALLAGRWEYIAGLTRWVWHDIRKLTGITNASSALVSSVEGRPYLYIGSTVVGEQVQKVYLTVVNDATADSGYKFCTSGSLWLPRYTTPLTAFIKKWIELFLRSKNLSDTKYINTYQSIDDGATFNLLAKFNTSPEQTKEYASGIESAMMNLRFDFVSDSETSPPVLEYFNLKAMTIVPSVSRFLHSIKCDSNLLLKHNMKDEKTKQSVLIAFVNTLRDSICTLADPWGNEHTVRVRVAGEKEVFDEDMKKPVLVYQIEAVKL